jgi:hypothetical protein
MVRAALRSSERLLGVLGEQGALEPGPFLGAFGVDLDPDHQDAAHRVPDRLDVVPGGEPRPDVRQRRGFGRAELAIDQVLDVISRSRASSPNGPLTLSNTLTGDAMP